MANSATLNVETNGFRNYIVRATYVSPDGAGITAQTIYDATSGYGGTTGISAGVSMFGQTFYPGVHTTVVGLDYDVQDVKVRLQWAAATPQDILALGNAPEDFNWERFGGIRVPSNLAGATGSIVLSTVNEVPQATFSIVLYLRKNVPVS